MNKIVSITVAFFLLTNIVNRVLSWNKGAQPNMNSSKLFALLLVSLFFINSDTYGQCNYPSGATKVGTEFGFCGSKIIEVNSVGNNNYVILNVVKGANYSFNFLETWAGGVNEVINVYNDAAPGAPIANGLGGDGVNVNYQPNFSGKIRILVNKTTCGSLDPDGTKGKLVMNLYSDWTGTPVQPTLIAISNLNCSSFTANWNAVPTATSYKLDVSTVSGFATFVAGYSNLDVGLVTSFNISGLASGTTYYYRLRAYNSGCGSTSTSSNFGSVVLSPTITTAATPAVINGVCQSTSIQTTTMAYTASANSPTHYSIDWANTLTDQGSTAFASAPGGGTVAGISVPAGVPAGTYTGNIKITNAGACFSTQAVILTVNSLPTPSEIIALQPTCSAPTGIITVKSLTAGNHYSINGTNYGNTSGIFDNLAAGSYPVSVSDGTCTSLPQPIVIKALITKTWDGREWSNGSNTPPSIDDDIVFAGDYISAGNINGCSCTVNSGTVTIKSGDVMTITNGVTNNGGTLTFENNASLIQTNNTLGLNSGNIIYKRVSTPMKNLDFTRWSSPVSEQKIGVLVPKSTRSYSWGTDNWITEGPNTVMYPPGRGYTIRLSSNVVSGTDTYRESVQFVGVPNNGQYNLPVNDPGLFNLMGNPYPSALSADAFLQENCLDIGSLEGTIYLWTHNTAASSKGYASADYATYNFTGGVGTNGGTASTTLGNNTVPSGFIAAGQGFFTVSKNGGTVVFKNEMRVGASKEALDNSNFFRGTNSKTVAAEKHRVWLNLTNEGGAFKQMLVGYLSGATAGYDSAFDGESFNGNSFVNFYSINENMTFTIQGRGLPFDTNDQVPLGYSTTIAGTFEISIDHTDGSLSNQPVYVEDKMTNVIHNLKNSSYSFSTAKGTFNDRFVLRYSDKAEGDSSLGNQTVDEKLKGVVVSVKNYTIKINSFDQTIDKVMVYDLKGSLLYEKNQLNGNEFTIPNFNSSKQFLIVMVQLSNGKGITKKVAF